MTLADYDGWCAAAGLTLVRRFATWAGEAYDGGGYAVSIHRRGRHAHPTRWAGLTRDPGHGS